MARVRNPLFSLEARGSVGKLVTFRVLTQKATDTDPHNWMPTFGNRRSQITTATASGFSKQPKPTSAKQLRRQKYMKDAAASWATLSAADKRAWFNDAWWNHRTAWQNFFNAFWVGNHSAGDIPLPPWWMVPAPPLVTYETPLDWPDLGQIVAHGRDQLNRTF